MKGYQAGISDFVSSDSIVFGISTDVLADNKRFAEKQKLDFALLSDEGGAVAKQYGGMNETSASRATYVVGKGGKVAFIAEGAEAMNPAGAKSACLGLK